jgi:hypothetical protein
MCYGVMMDVGIIVLLDRLLIRSDWVDTTLSNFLCK